MSKTKRLFLSESFGPLKSQAAFSYLKSNITNDDVITNTYRFFPYEAIAAYNGFQVGPILWNLSVDVAIVDFVSDFCIPSENKQYHLTYLESFARRLQTPPDISVPLFFRLTPESCFEMIRVATFTSSMLMSDVYKDIRLKYSLELALLTVYQDKTSLERIFITHSSKIGLLNNVLKQLKQRSLCQGIEPLVKKMTIGTLVQQYIAKYLLDIPNTDKSLIKYIKKNVATIQARGKSVEEALPIEYIFNLFNKLIIEAFYKFSDSGMQSRLDMALTSSKATEVALFMGQGHAHNLFPSIVPLESTSKSIRYDTRKGGVQYHIFADFHSDVKGRKAMLDSYFKKFTTPTKKFIQDYYKQFIYEPTLVQRIEGVSTDICDHIKWHNVAFNTPIDIEQCTQIISTDLQNNGPITQELCSGKFNEYFFIIWQLFDTQSDIAVCGVLKPNEEL